MRKALPPATNNHQSRTTTYQLLLTTYYPLPAHLRFPLLAYYLLLAMASRTHTYRPNRNQRDRSRNQRGRNSIYRASVAVKKQHVGHLIGRGGSVIRGLQQKYGIRSKIDEQNLRYLLSGPQRNVDAAVAEIQQTIAKLNALIWVNPNSSQKVTDDDGWTHSEEKVAVQPRRKVAKAIIAPTNRFDFGDSSDDEEEEEEETECIGPITGYKEHKPEGQWANGVTAAVKKEGQTRLSVGMLKQRLAVAEDELAKAEKALAYHQSQDTGSWADEADIADAEADVQDAQALVDRLTAEIANY